MKTAHADIHSIRTARTLIAEDSPFMLKTLAQMLALEGNSTLVGTATDGYQAVRQALPRGRIDSDGCSHASPESHRGHTILKTV